MYSNVSRSTQSIRYIVLLSFVAGLVACGSTGSLPASESPSVSVGTPEPSSPSVEATSPTAPETPNVVMENYEISDSGLGNAQLGLTLGELKQQMGEGVEFEPQPNFMVDFDAIAVRRSGDLLFYILHLAGQPFTDSDTIQGLMTDNPLYKTAEEVGPGTSIQDAEARYGNATLAYNTENEGREYVRFAQQSAPNLSFATGNSNQETAGLYASPVGGYNETQNYREGATIQSVLLVCLSETCAQAN